LAVVGNRWRGYRNVRAGSMVNRRAPFWLEAHRSSSSQN
jgi:hypothetical protein